MNDVLLKRITVNPHRCGGRPCIRGTRIRVSDILDLLGTGQSREALLTDFPDLETDDIRACLMFAARRVDVARVAA